MARPKPEVATAAQNRLFHDLEKHARFWLDNGSNCLGHLVPEVPSCPGAVRLIHILEEVGGVFGGPPTSWEVFECPSERGAPKYFGRRRVWCEAADLARVFDSPAQVRRARRLDPTMDVRDFELSPRRIKPLLEAMKCTAVPLAAAKQSIGLDGASYRVTIGHQPSCEMKLCWWLDGPPQWAAAIAWVGRLLRLMRKLAEQPPATCAPSHTHDRPKGSE